MRLEEGLLWLLRPVHLQGILQQLGDDLTGGPGRLGANRRLHFLEQDEVLALYLAEFGFQAGVLWRVEGVRVE